MQKLALVLLSSMSMVACASTTPDPSIYDSRVHMGPTAKPSEKKIIASAKPTKADAPSKNEHPDKLSNPFSSKAEEDLFWKILNGEASDAEIAPIKDTPGFKIVIALRMLMSCESTDQKLRGMMMQVLTAHIARIYMDDETYAAMMKDLLSDDMKDRWNALHFTFEQQVKGTAIIFYVLNDAEHLVEFFKKEHDKCEAAKKDGGDTTPNAPPPSGKPMKPAPPATSPHQGPTQSF